MVLVVVRVQLPGRYMSLTNSSWLCYSIFVMTNTATKRNEYALSLKFNHKIIRRVIIDQHYREKHSKTVNDPLILELVKELDQRVFDVEAERGEYQYFKVDPVFPSDGKDRPFRLILVLCIHDDYLGVINAYRIDRS